MSKRIKIKGAVLVTFKGGVWNGKSKQASAKRIVSPFRVSHSEGVDVYTLDGNTYIYRTREKK